MTTIHHTITSAIARWAVGIQRRRRRRVGERIMNDLPPSLQRDIGWDPVSRTRHT